MNECCYLRVVIVTGKEFCTNVELRHRKFCGAANDILSMRVSLTEECIMHIINAKAAPILAYGASVGKISYETRRRTGVYFNDRIRKIFGYFRYESVRQVLYEFGMLPMDLYIVRSRLLLLGSSLQSNRQLVRKCAEFVRDHDQFLQLVIKYNVDYDVSKRGVMCAFI